VLALSQASTITSIVVGGVVIVAAFVLIRLLLRTNPPARWRRMRVGVFVERDPLGGKDEPE
jgi:hypothetical protein